MMIKYVEKKISQVCRLDFGDLHYSFVHVAWNNILLDQRKRKEEKNARNSKHR